MPSSTAGCGGNATMWNACYYNNNTAPLSTVTFGIYHRYAMNNYTLVQGSAMSYTVPRNGSDYSCIQIPIPLTQQFKIQQGDIIAACIQASANESLNIIGSAPMGNTLIQPSPSTACNSSFRSVITSTTNVFRSVMHVRLGTWNWTFVLWKEAISGARMCLFITDVNECALDNGGCSQVCNDIALGNNCSCFPGYKLYTNSTFCYGNEISYTYMQPHVDKLYWVAIVVQFYMICAKISSTLWPIWLHRVWYFGDHYLWATE